MAHVVRRGFDWERLVWTSPGGELSPLCSYCSGGMGGEKPFRIVAGTETASSARAQLCTDCKTKWVYEQDNPPHPQARRR